MKRHIFVALILALAVAMGAVRGVAVAAPAAQLRALNVAADDASAALSLDLSAKVAYAVTTAKNPARIALTLRHARAAAGLVLPSSQGVVTGVTAQPQANGDLRVTVFLARTLPVRLKWDGSRGSAPTLRVRLSPDAHARLAAGRGADAGAVTAPRPVQAAHAPRESGRDIVIAVDAGHGGEDPGATGHGGAHEKDVVLAIARSLALRINGEPGMRAVLTRDRDEFLTLRDRIHRARVAKADLFVSIHADSIANSTVSGSSVYVLSEHGATNEAARWLAERENAADLMGGVSLSDKDRTLASVLLDLSQSANIRASMTAA
jgi:N-acetylmuramoyl-L-alanine amidase